MSSAPPDLLSALRSGRHGALDQLIPLVYEELRVIARRHLNARGGGGTFSTTVLVHEAYLKLVDQSRAEWQDRAHFLRLASVAMRHVLIDRAKAMATAKRGGGHKRITLDEEKLGAETEPEALLQLNDALEELAAIDPRLAQVVECRFFGGLTEPEIAEALGLNVRSVQRDWAKARMLLRRALGA